jgi:hypothetical protein
VCWAQVHMCTPTPAVAAFASIHSACTSVHHKAPPPTAPADLALLAGGPLQSKVVAKVHLGKHLGAAEARG